MEASSPKARSGRISEGSSRKVHLTHFTIKTSVNAWVLNLKCSRTVFSVYAENPVKALSHPQCLLGLMWPPSVSAHSASYTIRIREEQLMCPIGMLKPKQLKPLRVPHRLLPFLPKKESRTSLICKKYGEWTKQLQLCSEEKVPIDSLISGITYLCTFGLWWILRKPVWTIFLNTSNETLMISRKENCVGIYL